MSSAYRLSRHLITVFFPYRYRNIPVTSLPIRRPVRAGHDHGVEHTLAACRAARSVDRHRRFSAGCIHPYEFRGPESTGSSE